jgi:membrane protease YdiL (CAAX protease family)
MSQNDTIASQQPSLAPRLHVLLAVGFEGSLALLALGIGWLCGHWPLVGMFQPDSVKGECIAAAIGLAASIPPIVALWMVDYLPWVSLQHLRRLVRDLLQTWLGGASAGQLALVSLAAGVGEELLFRGLIQEGLARWIGPPLGVGVGLAVASMLFGACHWVSTTYAVLATAAGVYFGIWMILTGSVWTPLVAHAVYDFIALMYLLDARHGSARVG